MSAPPSPDPRQGLFETVLVADDHPVELDRHLARLGASVRELFGVEAPTAEIAAAAAAAALGTDLGRLRIDVLPASGGGIEHRVEVTPLDPAIFFPPRRRGAELRSVRAEGWSGAHKWSDRAWLERTERELGEEVPLLVDPDGHVLEAGRANAFAVIDGTLATPPADGSILPGTARAATLEIAAELGIEADERSLGLADLRDADEVFLTSSLRGIRPARLLDGEELGGAEEVSGQLAAGLRRRWLGAGSRALG